MSLSHRTFSAARWTTVSSLVRAGLQVAQIAILARYLSPKDYGLMAMVSVVLSYVALFSDFGLSTAFVQRQQISHEERSSLYWLSVAVGAVLMLLVMAASPLAAHFFKEPQLVPLMMLAATTFFVIPLGQQLRIDAEKALNFRPVALIEISAAITGFAIAVIAAWLGWNVYALVVSSMVTAWVALLLQWSFLANGWRPAWRLRWNEVRWYAHFGSGMVMNNVINQVNSTIDVFLGGRLLGAAQLGFYSIPRNLILQVQGMVNPIFTRVGFPLIASIQHDKERVKHVYLKTMNLTASVNAPIYVAIGFFAPEIVSVLLSDKWQHAAPLLRVLAIWGLLRSFGNPAGSLVFGLGRVRLALLWNLCLLLIVPPTLWWSAQYGATGMAWAMAGVMALLFIPGWAILIRPVCGAGLWAYSQQVVMPTLCAVLSGFVALLAVSTFSMPWLRVGVGWTLGLAAYILISWLLNRKCVDIVINTLRHGITPLDTVR